LVAFVKLLQCSNYPSQIALRQVFQVIGPVLVVHAYLSSSACAAGQTWIGRKTTQQKGRMEAASS
jgi:hypothetical protein